MRLGSGGKAIANVKMSTWRSNNASDQWVEAYTVHPCTVDGLAQLIVPAVTYENDYRPTMAPVRASSIWSNCCKLFPNVEGNMLAAASKLRGHRGATADIVGTILDSSGLVLYIESLETTFVGINSACGGVGQGEPRNLLTRLLWKPDVDTISHDNYCY
jgi:hypothetical protein